MKEKSNRRSFLKKMGISSIGAGLAPGIVFGQENENQGPESVGSGISVKRERAFNKPYRGEHLNRVAFPIGGMGAGMFCLEGTGAISHLSVKNRPDVFNNPVMFAAISVKGLANGTKIVEGQVPDWKKFGTPGSGNGSAGTTLGLPRFREAVFEARFPFGKITLKDDDLPLQVELTGWSPFVPTDADSSSLPAGALEYKITNTGKTSVEAVFSYNARNIVAEEGGKNAIRETTNGFILSESGPEDKSFLKSDFAIFTDDASTVVDYCWFRGGWWDPLTMAWNKIKAGEVKRVDPVADNAPGASLYVPLWLAPGQQKTVRVMMAWYTPDSNLTFGKTSTEEKNCAPGSDCCSTPTLLGLEYFEKDFDGEFYKPWYSSRFYSINDLARYWAANYETLRRNTSLFTEAFYASTLPDEVIEAVAANLTILKSPTMMRQYDGRLWNFEGCGDSWGCCHGTCTHVWNYAQAIPHLFPSLERGLRHTEFCEGQSLEGHQTFRAALPIRPVDHEFYAAADGQLGGIMKVYREWRISGDSEWMKKMYPMVKASMDYCIRTWDPKGRGVVEEPHHNTYDIEFWGPDGMCTSFYLGALTAIAKMGAFLGEDVSQYDRLIGLGKAFMESELYDGEYFIQKIQYTGLNAPNPVEVSGKTFGGEYSGEARSLLEQEGPKYQYGKGCLSDGVLGSWMARMCGFPDPLNQDKVRSHLMAVHKYNLKDNLSDHANPQRPAYALGDEGGLLLCSWPKGGKLSLPFVYSDEVWTGIEYQVASHLMLMGKVVEGLEIVRTCRKRYDGRTRNPFDEYECGHWYARALSSYGCLQALTGLRYDAVDKTLYINSKVGDFTSFLSTQSGFGTVSYKGGKISVNAVYGGIQVEEVIVGS